MAMSDGNDPWQDWNPDAATPDPNGWISKREAVKQYYRTALGREASEEEVDLQLRGGSGDLTTIMNAIYNSDEAKAYAARRTAAAPPAGGGGGGGGGGSTGRPGTLPRGVFDPFPAFTPPTRTVGPAPTFDYADFHAPTGDAVFNDPGYQFRSKEGLGRLQSTAAMKGLTRSGGTLNDLMTFNQDLASQEYKNVYDRSFQGWQANGLNAAAKFAPKLHEWDTQNSNAQLDWDNAWKAYQTNWATFKNNREWPYYVLSNERTAGMGSI